MLRSNLFIASHLVYNEMDEKCLQILPNLPSSAVDRGESAIEALIPWKDIRAVTIQTKAEFLQ